MANSPYRYLNKVMLKGRLGKDPDLRFMPSGDAVCNFSVATRSGEHVEWHKIVAYQKLAEYAKEVFARGDFVFVEAEIRTREFQTAEDKANNRTRSVRELIAAELHLLSKRGESADGDLSTDAESGSVMAGDVSGASTNQGDSEEAAGLPTFV